MFLVSDIALTPHWANGSHIAPPRELTVKQSQSPASLSGGPTLTCLILCTDDESPGLYGFLNVIVHSATGFKQSSSK